MDNIINNSSEGQKSPLRKIPSTPKFRGNIDEVITIPVPPVFPNSVQISDYDHICLLSSTMLTIMDISTMQRETIKVHKDRVKFNVGTLPGTENAFPSEIPPRLLQGVAVNFIAAVWSPAGVAPNGSSFLATVADDGRVAIYGVSFDCTSENTFVEVTELSQLLYSFWLEREFSLMSAHEPASKRQRKSNAPANLGFIQPTDYAYRLDLLSTQALAWSPIVANSPGNSQPFCLLALGSKAGKVTLWKYDITVSVLSSIGCNMSCVHVIDAHDTWVSQLSWLSNQTQGSVQTSNDLVLATGSVNGSVKIWHATIVEDSVQFSLMKEVSPADYFSVRSLCWRPSSDRRNSSLTVGKGSLLCLINPFADKTCDSHTSSHHNAILGLAWSRDYSKLFSCSMDGTVKSWEFSEIDFAIKCTRTITCSSEGVFGIVVSSTFMYLICLERVAAVADQMYEFRHPTSHVKFLCIESFEFKLDSAIEYACSHPNLYFSPWDVSKVLSNSPLDRYQALISTLEKRYNSSVDKEHMNTVGLHQLANSNMLHVLRVANALIFGLKKCTDQAIQDFKSQNMFELIQLHIYSVTNSFLSNYKTNEVHPLERTSLLLMADFITRNAKTVYAPMLDLAESIYRQFKCTSETKQLSQLRQNFDVSRLSLAARETCPICQVAVDFSSYTQDVCKNGHAFGRCVRTLLLLDSPNVWHCNCSSQSLILGGEGQPNVGAEFNWMRYPGKIAAPLCPMCGFAFYQLRFALFVQRNSIK